jgi:hypothetical protein
MGGKASHEADAKETNTKENQGRNPDGTFVKGSEAAKEAGHIGGLHAAGKEDVGKNRDGRREDGTFLPGSEVGQSTIQRLCSC